MIVDSRGRLTLMGLVMADGDHLQPNATEESTIANPFCRLLFRVLVATYWKAPLRLPVFSARLTVGGVSSVLEPLLRPTPHTDHDFE